MTEDASAREQRVFRDSRRMIFMQIVSASGFVALAFLLGVSFFVPTESPSNPDGLTLTSKAVEIAVLALAATAMAWMFRGARRTRLVIGRDAVEIRNSFKTLDVPLSEVAGFVVRGGTGVALLRKDGSAIPVSAVSRLPGRRMEETVGQLNSAANLGPSLRGMTENASERPTISVDEASQIARASLSPVELRWFASTVTFAIDQACRSQSRLGKSAAQGGLMSAVHGAIAAQLTFTAGAFSMAAAAVETLHFSSHAPLEIAAPLMAVLFGLAAAAFWYASVEIRRSRASAISFSEGRGNDLFKLPPASGPPVPGSVWGGAILCLLGADLIVTGWCLHSAKFVAPRAAGIYLLAIGMLILTLGLGVVQRARRAVTGNDQ